MRMHSYYLSKSLLFTALVALMGCNSKADSADFTKVQARAVLTAKVVPAAQRDNAYIGVIAARTQSELGFRVSGKVTQRLVDPGDRVARGDVLLVLDNQDFDLALRTATNRVQAAQAQLIQASDDEGRYRRLAKTGAIPRQLFDQSATRLQVLEAELAAAKAEASQVANRRDYSILTADGDGIITQVLVERGQVVTEGQIVAHLAHDGPREALIYIPETQRALASNSAMAYPFGSTEKAVKASLRELSATAEPTTRTFAARYVLAGQAERFALGSTITVHLLSSPQSNLLRVPIGALYDSGTGPGVWLIDENNRVSLAAVQVASLGQEFALLHSGVSDGQQVVALGAHLLHAGDWVRKLPAQNSLQALQQARQHEH